MDELIISITPGTHLETTGYLIADCSGCPDHHIAGGPFVMIQGAIGVHVVAVHPGCGAMVLHNYPGGSDHPDTKIED